jgi:hypothetical protein
MSAIRVERRGGSSTDQQCVYHVLINGERRGALKSGESEMFEVPPGIHTVKLGLATYNSPAVKVVVGMGTTSLVCRTNQERRYPLFGPLVPSTQMVVHEEADQVVVPMIRPAARRADAPRMAPSWNSGGEPDRLAAD